MTIKEKLKNDILYVITNLCDNPEPTFTDNLHDRAHLLRQKGWNNLHVLSTATETETIEAMKEIATELHN